MYERQIHYATELMEMTVGFSGIAPKFPARRHVTHMGDTTLNNIQVTNSQIGVLNTGIVETIDSSLTVLQTQADSGFVLAVKSLVESVVSSDTMTNKQKNDILEILGSLSQEAVVPADHRKTAVAAALLAQLSVMFQGISGLNELWINAEEAFKLLFGIS